MVKWGVVTEPVSRAIRPWILGVAIVGLAIGGVSASRLSDHRARERSVAVAPAFNQVAAAPEQIAVPERIRVLTDSERLNLLFVDPGVGDIFIGRVEAVDDSRQTPDLGMGAARYFVSMRFRVLDPIGGSSQAGESVNIFAGTPIGGPGTKPTSEDFSNTYDLPAKPDALVGRIIVVFRQRLKIPVTKDGGYWADNLYILPASSQIDQAIPSADGSFESLSYGPQSVRLGDPRTLTLDDLRRLAPGSQTARDERKARNEALKKLIETGPESLTTREYSGPPTTLVSPPTPRATSSTTFAGEPR